MTTPVYCDPARRHDFAFLIDVVNGNPNGDPDSGNAPRIDPETMKGLITDVCVKRKIRDWVDLTHGEEKGYRIYIQNNGIALNAYHEQAHQAVFGAPPENETKDKEKKINEHDGARQNARREWLCDQFYDVRTFGAVMSTGDYPAAQVRGPIQITFSESIDPIMPMDISITRVAVAELDEKKKTTTTMGRKAYVPYGLYIGHGFFIPSFARRTGFNAEDLELFWEALQGLWDIDRSAARGMMALQGLYVFSHENGLGNAPAHKLFQRIGIQRTNGNVARSITDYMITVDEEGLPEGIILTRLA